jgi:Caspase domain
LTSASGNPNIARGVKVSVNILKVIAVLAFAGFASSAGQEQDIWLEIPGTGITLPANDSTAIPDADIPTLRIVIAHQPSQVNYGSILAKVNTESANTIMNVKSTSEGIVCELELNRRAGFRLHPGRNSVELAFFDSFHRLRYASFLLQTKQPEAEPRIERTRQPSLPSGTKFAVVIGISKYRNGGAALPNPRFADRDAQDFYDFLTSPDGGGFAPANVKLLLNQDARLENLQSVLSDFVAQAREEDTVVFFFAGHGGADTEDEGTIQGKSNLYLAGTDVDPANIRGTALSMAELQQFFEESVRSRYVITFVDACRILAMHSIRKEKPGHQNNLINQYVNRLAGKEERAVITASDISEVSEESDRWGGGHGVFTYFVLRGLRGEADLNGDGVVTVGELFSFVRDHVYKETAGAQKPIIHPGAYANLALRRRTQQASQVRGQQAIDSGSPVGR